MKKTTVTIQHLFHGEGNAGLSFNDWHSLTPENQLRARLQFITLRSSSLAKTPYDTKSGLLANVWQIAKRITNLATQAADTKELISVSMLCIDIGKLIESIKTQCLGSEAIKFKVQLLEPKSKGGEATAAIKKTKAEENQTRAREIWFELAGKDERSRCETIADRMGVKPNTVRGWIRKAGLR
jgi:hypothetical protein